MAMLDHALKYCDLGMRVIPLHHDGPDKGVAHIKEWQHLASCERKQALEWWKRWPSAWIGILTGADAGLLVVDLDVKGGKDGIAEWESLGHGAPAEFVTPRVRTRSGGEHLYFKTDQDFTGQVGWRAGIDIRSWHNLVVAPPSGGRRWLLEPDVPWMALPGWLGDLLSEKGTSAEREATTGEGRSHLADLLANPPGGDETGWNDWLIKVAGHYAKLIPYEDAYRTLVDQAAESLDGSWEEGQVDKVATSAWSAEESKTGEPPGGRAQLALIRARDWAREQHLQEQFDDSFQMPTSLSWAQEAELDEPALEWSIEELHPTGSNSLLTAQFKSGKTTFLMNLAVSLVDGTPFLGRFPVHHTGNVGFFNYELSGRQFRDWAKRITCEHPENIFSMHLRGFRLPFWDHRVETQLVRWLQENEIVTLILDPWARVFSGAGDENSNSDVSPVLETLDVIKKLAGVKDLFLATHTGRGTEGKASNNRTRGATRLDDWPDALWTLEKEGRNRWFDALGRDVGLDSRLRIDFDKRTWRQTAVETDATMEVATQVGSMVTMIVQWLRQHPGATKTKVLSALKGSGTGSGKIEEAFKQAVRDGRIVNHGSGTSHAWYALETEPEGGDECEPS